MPRSLKSKPLLVGESNPYGGRPYYALYPAPDGCSGHRLCTLILGMPRSKYLEVFARTNLCSGPWLMAEAYENAQKLRVWKAPIILFGSKVSLAFEFRPFEPFTVADGGKTLVLPHPSGLCRMWSEPGAIERARALVAEVVPEVAHLLGTYSRQNDEDDD
jgi:hypothetical protein